MAAGLVVEPVVADATVHPQLKVESMRASLSEAWQVDCLASIDDLEPFLDWIPEGGFLCDGVRITAEALEKRARAVIQTAAGPVDVVVQVASGFLDSFCKDMADDSR